MDSEDSITLIISGVPKASSWKRLRKIIEKHAQEDIELQLIPQEVFNIVEVSCSSGFGYERLLQVPCDQLLELSNTIHIYKLMESDPPLNNESKILELNYDCLRYVFTNCSPKDQIAVAKVCRSFYETIRDIWCGQARTFLYNPYVMEFDQNLSNENVREMFAIVGCAVETLRYNTIFFYPMIQRYLSDLPGNMVKLARNFVNANLCRNLIYMENLIVFEVGGKFITDFTVRELARYCKELRVFRLLDVDVRCLKGQYFPELIKLEELSIRDCKSFLGRHLVQTCKTANIKYLDIVDCANFQNPKFMQTLCGFLPNLEVLKLTAQANDTMLSTILKLPKLRELQFFWVAKKLNGFEKILLEHLAEIKANSLIRLKFENDRIEIDNQSMMNNESAEMYALMRETTTLSGKDWSLDEEFEKLKKSFDKFTTLKEINFEYCRPISHEYLIDLSVTCSSLRSIRLVGCSSRIDKDVLAQFKMTQARLKPQREFCELCFESLKTAEQIEQIKQRLGAPRSDFYLTPTLRSIECSFN